MNEMEFRGPDLARWFGDEGSESLEKCRLMLSRRLGVFGHQLAEEYTQQAFTRFFESPERFQGTLTQFQKWICVVGFNLARDERRSRKDTQELPEGFFEPNSPLSLLETLEALDLLESALKTLSFLERSVLIKRALYGVPFDELAKDFQISPESVRQALSRARRKIRTQIHTWN